MKIEEMNRAECTGCEACANVCPKNAVKMIRDAEGFAYPKINRELCAACGSCDAVCPALNFAKTFPDALPKAFAAIHTDKKIRLHSSAGGVFSALAEIILRDGGVVFGASFDEKFHVSHTCARTLDELANLRGKKYVQSQIGEIYRQVADALQTGGVLFSGTPCQCAGLKNFLGEEPENLLTVDLICHGVPSPALWESYIGELNYAHEVTHVNFASKKMSRKIPYVEVNFSDCSHYLNRLDVDVYGGAFLRGLSERPSCHACKFKFPSMQSDLTLGGAAEILDDSNATLVIVHSAKGKKFFEQAALKSQEVNFIDAVIKNPRFLTSTVADFRRADFFDELAESTRKLTVLQKYSVEDAAARQKSAEQSQRVFLQSYRTLLERYRRHTERNILIVTPQLDDAAQKFLADYFERNFPNCGLYFLALERKGRLLCYEKFTSLIFALKEDADTLNEFAAQFNVTELFASNRIKYNSEILVEWFKSCGLPVNIFALKEI